MRILRLSFLGLFLVFNSSCVIFRSGPVDPKQPLTEKLSGESYSSAGVGPGVVVLNRKTIQRKITGRVLCGEGLSQRPANGAQVELLENEKLVARNTAAADGAYAVMGNIQFGTVLLLKAKSPCGNFSSAVSLNEKELSHYDIILK